MKVGVIIQARMDSSRLPGKVLMNLPFGTEETLISQLYRQLKKVEIVDEVILATSNEKNDDLLFNYGIKNNITTERGDKDNVLFRFVEVIERRKLDVVIRVTGDNPIVLVDVMGSAIERHIHEKVDYTRNINLPYGTSFEIVNASILTTILDKNIISTTEAEHVTLFIKNNREQFSILELDHEFDKIDFRFTIDYPTDYAAMNILFQHLSSNDYQYNFDDLKAFINKNLWIKDVNENNVQKNQHTSYEDEYKDAMNLLKLRGLNRVIEKLQSIK